MQPYKIPHIPGWQTEWMPYTDCYGLYKWARRDEQGYVELSKGINDTIRRHRWVYINEHGAIPEGYVVNHINRIRGDDHPDNLEALSRSAHQKKHIHERKSGKIPIGIPFL